MTVRELAEQIGLVSMSEFEDREFTGVFVSDMISDVMAGAQSGNLWLTIQTHKSIIPAANLVDVAAIIITSGKEIPAETVELASKHNMAILGTEQATFDMVGRLYGMGLGTA